MTFSLIGRCARTGHFGAVATTSGLAIGARVPFLAAGVGGVLTQHRTDPRLGPRGVALLRSGCSAREAVAALAASTPHHGWRQLAAIDAAGRTAWFHGARVKPAHGHAEGADCIAIGNILASEAVPGAMVAAFVNEPEAALGDRLIAALKAGEAAGGEGRPLVSAALLIAGTESFPYADLRVDRDADPVGALAALWAAYAPEADEYVLRAIDPEGFSPV